MSSVGLELKETAYHADMLRDVLRCKQPAGFQFTSLDRQKMVIYRAIIAPQVPDDVKDEKQETERVSARRE
jgi:hypothetical protein